MKTKSESLDPVWDIALRMAHEQQRDAWNSGRQFDLFIQVVVNYAQLQIEFLTPAEVQS